MSIQFPLPNGWTLSICEELPAALCGIAAWPSAKDGEARADVSDWFDFGDGRYDLRCYDLDEMLAAIEQVRSAPRPV